MKRISAAQLVAAARAKGAVLDLDDATINAEGAKTAATPMPRRALAAVPPAPPPPVRVEMDTKALVEASARQAEQMGRLVAALVTEMRAQRDASPAPIKAWEFKVQRDDKDRLDTLRATAIR